MEIAGLLIVLILALVALTKISRLEREVARLSAMLPKAGAPQPIVPVAETAPTPEPVAAVEAPEPAPEILPSAYEAVAAEPPPKRDVEQAVASRWFVWVGGIAIAVGGVLFVKYAVDNELLSPAMRCAVGLIFGLILILAGELLRRRTVARETYVPAAVTAAGLVIAFGSIFAAYSFYGLIDPKTAFAGLAIVALGAFALSLAQGPLIAALGLIGSYATPAIIPSVDPTAATFFPYLFIILAASFAVQRRRSGWWWLGIAAILGALAWTALWIGSGIYEPGDMVPIGLFAVALVAVPLLAFAGRPIGQSIQISAFLGTLAGFLVLAALAVRDGHSPASLSLVAAAAAIAFIGAMREKFDFLAPEAVALCLVALAGWSARDFTAPAYDEFGTYVLVLGPESLRFLRWMAGFGAAFIVVCYIAMWARPNPALWAATGLGTVLGYGFVAYGRAPNAISDTQWMWIAAGLAVLHLVGMLAGRRRITDRGFNTALGLHGIAAAALAAFACAMLLEGVRLTMAWSLLVPVLAVIAYGLPVRYLGAIASILAAVVTIRLLSARELWFDSNNLWLGPHFVLYAYGIPAVLFWLSSLVFRRRENTRPAVALEGTALGLAIALISLELRVLIGGGVSAPEPGLLESSAHALAWLGAAFGLLHRLKHAPSPVPVWGSRLLVLAASAILIFGNLGTLNPVVTERQIEGGVFGNTLLLAYLLPALLVALIVPRLGRIGWDGTKPLFGIFALILALVYLTLQTKRYFQGPVLTLESLSDAENYAYSAVWLVFALALLIAGIWRGRKYLRYAGLIVTALVVVKVFLLDMSGLSGLYRIASFVGLGLCLVGIGYLYARFVQPLDAPKAEAPPATG
ncbi:MAG: DUF2339 domain-containing protein [Rhizobiales bacterium]|nr:DUF2339 domain-containing protein [Hyphomicrobiales bacterium]